MEIDISLPSGDLIPATELTNPHRAYGVFMRLQGAELQFLVLRKRNSHALFQGEEQWSIPGGGIEEGETPEEAVLRELRQETGEHEGGGFQVVGRLMRLMHIGVENRHGFSDPAIFFHMVVDKIHGEFKENNEMSHHAWKSRKHVKDLVDEGRMDERWYAAITLAEHAFHQMKRSLRRSSGEVH